MSRSLNEFEKQWKDLQKANCWGVSGYDKKLARVIWKAALRMIKSEGVISDYELAGKIIKDELGE